MQVHKYCIYIAIYIICALHAYILNICSIYDIYMHISVNIYMHMYIYAYIHICFTHTPHILHKSYFKSHKYELSPFFHHKQWNSSSFLQF